MTEQRRQSSFHECERCGFPAPSKERLIRHVKDGMQCRPLKSKISLEDLMKKLRPPALMASLVCPHCNQQCKSKGGLTTHLKHCKQKETNISQQDNNCVPSSSSTATATENEVVEQKEKKHVYFHKNVVVHKALHPFQTEIEWETFDIEPSFVLDCCECRTNGIVELFAYVHRHPNHDNIKWSNNKLIVFNGKGWVEATENVLIKHIGFLYFFLEEKWCDYQSNLRCGVVEPKNIIDEETQKDIDKFFYDDIVDDESVYFHCKDVLQDYLSSLKD